MRLMGGIGDHIFMSVVGKVVKQKFPNAEVIYVVPEEFFAVYKGYPYIDRVTSDKDVPADIKIDCTDIDYRIEMIEMQKFGKIETPRSKIYLEYLGMFEDVSPEFFVLEKERLWALNEWPVEKDKKRIAVSVQASNKIKSWPGVDALLQMLKKNPKYDTKVVDEGSGNYFKYSFRQGAALVSIADLVVSMDSGFSNVAGALKKPVVCLFGYRNGYIFNEMFPSMRIVQGKCPLDEKIVGCDYNVRCFEGKVHRDKENIGPAPCLVNMKPSTILERIEEVFG
jgi:hypothetical protein